MTTLDVIEVWRKRSRSSRSGYSDEDRERALEACQDILNQRGVAGFNTADEAANFVAEAAAGLEDDPRVARCIAQVFG